MQRVLQATGGLQGCGRTGDTLSISLSLLFSNCNITAFIIAIYCRCVEARAPAVWLGREESTASFADTTLASRFAAERTQECDYNPCFLQAGMAPGAVRQEPRQGRDQLGWLEQVLISTWRIHRVKISGPVFLGSDVPQGDVGASSSLVLGQSSHGETADGDCHRVADHC